MSFQHYARKVRDPSRDPRLRLAALRSCISRFCWCTGRPYRDTLVRFAVSAAPYPSPAGEAFLMDALAQVEAERGRYLAGRAAFDESRRETKRAGGRQPSNAERATLRRLADPPPGSLDEEAGG
jgi:hypothetical protein